MTLWEDRDLPVLRGLRATSDPDLRDHGFLNLMDPPHANEALNVEFDLDTIRDSLYILRDAGYVDFGDDRDAGDLLTQLAITGRGLQVLGEWPRFEVVVSPSTVATLLERLAPEAATADETSSLRRAATYVRGVAPGAFKQLAVGAINAYVRTHIGHV